VVGQAASVVAREGVVVQRAASVVAREDVVVRQAASVGLWAGLDAGLLQ